LRANNATDKQIVDRRNATEMSWKLILRLGELAISLILATSLFLAWHAERNDRAKLAAQLAAAQQSLTQATDRQQSRDADLLHTLASLTEQKRTVQTPEQILKELPQQIPLPQPIVLEQSGPTPPNSPAANSTNLAPVTNSKPADPLHENAAKPAAPEPQAVIPTADLKPLYDFALDCKACQAKLAAAQSDLTDEKSKTATLTKERDEAVRTAKGGSTLQRFARAAKWLLIGAAAGTLAARATR
jgi:hypothetical protein